MSESVSISRLSPSNLAMLEENAMASSKSKVPRFIGIACFTLCLGFAAAGCTTVKGAFSVPDTSPPVHFVGASPEQQGALYQQQGVMTKQDYLRLTKIQEGIDQTQKVSDEDVAFLQQRLGSLPVQGASPTEIQAENFVISHTYGSLGHKPKHLTPSQRSRLYNAIVPFTRSPDQWVEVNASLALASTRDPRAVFVLEGMAQNSPYPVVRLDANAWLKRLRALPLTSGQ